MKRFGKCIGLLLCLMLGAQTVCAQMSSKEIRHILDRTSAKIRKANPLSSTFTIAQYKGSSQTSNFSGQFYMDGAKYYVSTSYAQVWYDGHTQWAYNKAGNEVNVSNLDKKQAATSHPYYFINLYQKGYVATASSEVVRGKDCYDIRLVATQNQSIKEMRLSIDKQTLLPLCVRLRQGSSNWTRISITGWNPNQKIAASTFAFPYKKYPDVEIVDLR